MAKKTKRATAGRSKPAGRSAGAKSSAAKTAKTARSPAPRKTAAWRIPHYRQTTDFTCGPSSALMSMRALDPQAPFDRASELQLWREATSVFSGPSGGHGGCGPVALALALGRRGFKAEVHINHRDVFMGERTRSAERKEVMRVLQEKDLAEANRQGISIHYETLSQRQLEERFQQGMIPIVLVSTFYIHGDHVAHWVVVTGFDRMTCYGKQRERACVLVGR